MLSITHRRRGALAASLLAALAFAQVAAAQLIPQAARGDDAAHALGADEIPSLAAVTVGACCINGVCTNIGESECAEANGDFAGEGTFCEDVCCPFTIDFETVFLGVAGAPADNGMPFEGMFVTDTPLMTVLSDGYNNGAAAFDSTPGVNADDEDLQADQGNVLMLQQKHLAQTDQDGNFIRPNDAAQGGTIFLNVVSGAIEPLSIDLLDICATDGEGATITLFSLTEPNPAGPAPFRRYHVPAGWTSTEDGGVRTLDLTTLADQPGTGGTVATAEEIGAYSPFLVFGVRVELDGSGAIDNLVYCLTGAF